VEAVEVNPMSADEAFFMAEKGAHQPVVRRVMTRLGQKFGGNKEAFRSLKDPNMAVLKSDDLHKMLQTTTYGLSKEEADEVMRHADQSGDGFIDYSEFCNTMMPQERNLKGNPIETLRDRGRTPFGFKEKRDVFTQEFTSASSSTRGATRFSAGFGSKTNRNLTDTFQNIRPDQYNAPNQYSKDNECFTTTSQSGLLAGNGGVINERGRFRVPWAIKTQRNEDRVLSVHDMLDQKSEDRKENRAKNIHNRRMVYVNGLHHDYANQPRLSMRFLHG